MHINELFWAVDKDKISDDFLQHIINMYTRKKLFCLEYVALLEEKLNRIEENE